MFHEVMSSPFRKRSRCGTPDILSIYFTEWIQARYVKFYSKPNLDCNLYFIITLKLLPYLVQLLPLIHS